MTKREQFKRAVIEAIHGLPYEEAVKKEEGECDCYGYCPPKYRHKNRSITIGRVMQAIIKKQTKPVACFGESIRIGDDYFSWFLTKEGGMECTDDDQSDETIEALSKLL